METIAVLRDGLERHLLLLGGLELRLERAALAHLLHQVEDLVEIVVVVVLHRFYLALEIGNLLDLELILPELVLGSLGALHLLAQDVDLVLQVPVLAGQLGTVVHLPPQLKHLLLLVLDHLLQLLISSLTRRSLIVLSDDCCFWSSRRFCANSSDCCRLEHT
ncbi:hypothetical protein SAMD00019534_126600 [Acytostelium subglobosum LB1]|uniref:hypothetical protein n=1 Tax=Acytostelium subglobosum LB1 TaxID=1410327 RepID=UPI000644840C|nr:hypothetical protein SAMD00019534_126600 [Acytostelium subglobosum LB1]GAM29484.1 hypothetical protein SAMD00019534_126600 [Acytostelium subglobosum LB1]|eukprot:XP_012747570.1 hypothetical protein SAMD00019534_126600 [Acytostelium subglobosum LB1]